MSQGWIKLHRKIQESPLYKSLNSKQRDVMIQLLIMANHSQNEWEWNGQIFKTNTGQFITSIQSIKEKCANDVSIQSVRTALLKLEKWHFLTNESTKDGRLITICNYSVYQNGDDETNKQINKELTKDQQSTNKELTTNKNDKNVKNEKNEKNLKERTKEEPPDEISLLWIKTFGKNPNLIEREESQKLIKEFGKHRVEKEFREAIINGAKSLRYVINKLSGNVRNFKQSQSNKNFKQSEKNNKSNFTKDGYVGREFGKDFGSAIVAD